MNALPDGPVVMGIVNRTTDSFYAPAATLADEAAQARVHQVVAEGAGIVDIGGVRAGDTGRSVTPAEELARVVDFTAWVRETYPQVVISVDTYRAEVADAALGAGADLVNDAWGGWTPELVDVAAAHDAGIVCTHANGIAPHSDAVRHDYDDVVAVVRDACVAYAERALAAGVKRERIVIDPAHDFAKSTAQSLEVTRRLNELVATGWPVLVSLSRKDFVGETLDLPVDERLAGTLAATAISAWQGARVFRAHDVAATRQVLDMVASIQGVRPPSAPVRGI